MSFDHDSHHGPCPWPWEPACCDAECVDEAVLLRVQAIAQDILWRASGRRFGLCETTVRPCRPGCADSTTYGDPLTGSLRPYILNGSWFNCGDCASCGECRCCNAGCSEVPLPGPVQEILEVVVDGVQVPTSILEVQDHRWLVRMDGRCWPDCQDMGVPAGAPGSWTVRYSYGLPLGPSGTAAYSAYVCELYKACTGARCRLPANVEGVFRQGVNIDLSDDNLDLLSKGRTGLPEVDRWLASVNPFGLHEQSKVYSPDVRRPRTTTWAGQ